MKRLFVVFGIMSVLLTGCAEEAPAKVVGPTDLDLVKSCNFHITSASIRARDEENKSRNSDGSISIPVLYLGTFYSKTEKACISIYNFFDVSPSTSWYSYYNEKTKVYFKKSQNGDEESTENKLNLIR